MGAWLRRCWCWGGGSVGCSAPWPGGVLVLLRAAAVADGKLLFPREVQWDAAGSDDGQRGAPCEHLAHGGAMRPAGARSCPGPAGPDRRPGLPPGGPATGARIGTRSRNAHPTAVRWRPVPAPRLRWPPARARQPRRFVRTTAGSRRAGAVWGAVRGRRSTPWPEPCADPGVALRRALWYREASRHAGSRGDVSPGVFRRPSSVRDGSGGTRGCRPNSHGSCRGRRRPETCLERFWKFPHATRPKRRGGQSQAWGRSRPCA
jgi:hypothetical protein